jgi:hypothetical protein
MIHSFLSIHSYPFILIHSFCIHHSSPFILLHSFFSIHSSPFILLHSFLSIIHSRSKYSVHSPFCLMKLPSSPKGPISENPSLSLHNLDIQGHNASQRSIHHSGPGCYLELTSTSASALHCLRTITSSQTSLPSPLQGIGSDIPRTINGQGHEHNAPHTARKAVNPSRS